MKFILTLFINCTLLLNANAQKMKEYKVEIDINASKEVVWKIMTDFAAYPKWNSVLQMQNNDSLLLGNAFEVSITQPNGKQSNFKAIAISEKNFESFSAQQKIIGKWFFQATHHFIIEETDKNHVTFIQRWEFRGIVTAVFHKQIFRELEVFKKMNKELQDFAEK
jgi:hypothetical protein